MQRSDGASSSYSTRATASSSNWAATCIGLKAVEQQAKLRELAGGGLEQTAHVEEYHADYVIKSRSFGRCFQVFFLDDKRVSANRSDEGNRDIQG
jgi:hypothetical protein